MSADEALRPTRAEIDLNALAHNLSVVRKTAGKAKVLAVVKADAYGHGVGPVAQRLEAEGVDGFGVALAEEGIELREAGIDAQIIVLNGVHAGAHREVVEAGLTPVIYDLDEANAFSRVATRAPVGVHLEIDTGMARLGVQLHKLNEFLEGFERLEGVRIDGVMTHFSSADELDSETTRSQLRLFEEARGMITARGHRPKLIHAANSAGMFAHPSARFDMVRPGLALFGIEPAKGTTNELLPAMRLRTEVIAMRELPAGAPVGYSEAFHTQRTTQIATVPMGYGDGLMRAASNRGMMLVRGHACRIVGNVSMDLTTLDVTDVPGVRVGDEVVVLGEQSGAFARAEDLALAAGTIPYEVLTNVSRRVPRFYR